MEQKEQMKRRRGQKMANKPQINKLISKVNFSDSNRSAGQIKYLVKHYVGATGGAEANCKYFYDTYRGASAHFFVGHNGEIWQCVEENDTAWHCGAKSYKHSECRNSNSIGVELCVKKDKNGKWYYTEKTKKAAIQLFAYLMDKYGIDESHVLRHFDVTGKIWDVGCRHNWSSDTFNASANLMSVETLPSPRFSKSSIVRTETPERRDNSGTDRFCDFRISLRFISAS